MSHANLKATIAVFTLALLFPVNAAELPESLALALENTHRTDSNNWAYTRESHDDVGHYTERFDPSLPPQEQWKLIAFDDKEPLEEHYKLHRENYAELAERDSPTAPDFDDLINPETVELVEETNEMLTYSFQPAADDEDDEKIVPHLQGTIVVDRRSQSVMRISIVNKRKIKPVPMVSIKHLEMHINLEEVQPGGPVFITSTESVTQGRFMGLKKFSEEERVEFRDFVLSK